MKTCWPLIVLLAGCAPGEPDALPNDPMRVLKTKASVPVPIEAMAERSGKSLARLGRGHAVFSTKCVECHEPRVAVSTGDPNWRPTMHGMSRNADLNAADEEALVDYLRAAGEELSGNDFRG